MIFPGRQTSPHQNLPPHPAPPSVSGAGAAAKDLGWGHRECPAGLGELLPALPKALHSHIRQWFSFSCSSPEAWLGHATHRLLGQVTFKWKHTFLGSNDERALVLSLQPALTIDEVSHVLGLCQRGGFDGQGLQGRDQPGMRPRALAGVNPAGLQDS